MALQSLLLPATQRTLVREIPDVRILPYGGVWGQRVPDVDREHNDLTEFDRAITTAGDFLAPSATMVAKTRPANVVILNKAFQFGRSEQFNQSDMEAILTANAAPQVASFRQRVLDNARRSTERNLQGTAINRGILIAAAAVGEIDWTQFGYIASPTAFLMPAEMKLVPSVYWRTTLGVPNTAATPISDMSALDLQASYWGQGPFTDVDMSYQAYLAMVSTTQYQNQALRLVAGYTTAALPVQGTPDAFDLAARVIGKRIHIVDGTYTREEASGAVTQGLRYFREGLAVLWRSASIAQELIFANVPLTKSAIASMMGDQALGGAGNVVRGPATWGGGDRDQFTHASLYAAQEGVPIRNNRAATATIETRG